MTAILGISAFYHDSAAALVVDGRIVAAAQEERFTRSKHDHRLPVRAIEYCLRAGGLEAGGLDYVGFYDKPLLKFERLLETYLACAPAGFRSFRLIIPGWLNEKLHIPREIRRGLGGRYSRGCVFTRHHEAHAASAFFPSPFHEAAILTLDGVGEWTTASYGVGRKGRIMLAAELRFPHSLGLLYSAFTYFCGFRVNSGEHKLMGLAPYGEPRYAELILQKLMDLKPDGSFRLDLSYFDYCHGLRMTSAKFHRLFGGPPRRPEGPLTEREMDLAASIQKVTEEVVLRAAGHVHQQTGLKNLCLAGGVALNCVANGRLLREGPFERLWIQPAAGDAGAALGTALFIWHQLLGHPHQPEDSDSQQGSLLGPEYSDAEILTFLQTAGARHRRFANQSELCDHVARLIAAGKVVGWMQGRAEFGPRALGNRSVLADARRPDMQSHLNQKIKFRELFRPFAPAVLRERASELFELRPGDESPYMLLVARVKGACELSETSEGRRLHAVCSQLPAATHVDGSARVQTVDPKRHGRFYELLQALERKTGCPVVVNTSFNVRGEPIVCSPEDAYRCFLATGMDALVMGDFVLVKDSSGRAAPPASAHGTRRVPATLAADSASRGGLIRIDHQPSRCKLGLFALGWLVFLGVVGWVLLTSGSGWTAPALAWILAGLVPLVGWFLPATMRMLYLAAAYAAFPAGLVISHLVLAAVYYCVLTPTGLLMRLLGHDPLARRLDRAARSYWSPWDADQGTDHYFRQF